MDSVEHRWRFSILLALLMVPFLGKSSSPVPFEESEVIKRLEMMDNEVVTPRYDVVVRSYLRTYLVNHRAKAEKILGRRVQYFPIFEDYLRQKKLPTDLKYLAIVESALEPRATSRVGAAGLWQFMPGTGKAYGLQVDAMVDERRDPMRSTEAAVEHLQDLYEKFESWELAIAAYNSGSGRISRAVKRARSSNYWKIRGYLPRETANYVPAFIAASYLVKHFEDHGLEPEYPALDLQMTETISIFQEVTFEEISQATGVPLEIIATLNPAFPQEKVPASTKGYYFTLPQRAMKEFRMLLDSKRPDANISAFALSSPVLIKIPKEAINPSYIPVYVEVEEGQTLDKIAQQWHCSAYQIRAWNQLKPSQSIAAGQKLIIYQLKDNLPPLVKFELIAPLEPLPSEEIEPVAWKPEEDEGEAVISNLRTNSFLQYKVNRPESLQSISLRFMVDLQKLRAMNGIETTRNLKPGTIVKIVPLQENNN